MASNIWQRITQREETCYRHYAYMRYFFRLTARVLLYAPSHTYDSTYHDLCYTSSEMWFRGKIIESWCGSILRDGERETFYLTTHSTHFIYGYMASDIWLRTILIVRKETCCCHIGYSYQLTARVLLYAPSHRQDNTYHGLCYTSRGALAGTRNSSMGPPPPMKDRSDDPSHHERMLYL